jgi:hypothetical protein
MIVDFLADVRRSVLGGSQAFIPAPLLNEGP